MIAFLSDDGLIETFRSSRASGGATATARSWPDEVIDTRLVQLRPGCRPRMEALCRWRGGGADGEDVEEWRHATAKNIGTRLLKLARGSRAQAGGAGDPNRVHPLRETREALRRKREGEELAAVFRRQRRRQPLSTIVEDDDDM
jgi:hypothetical protein